MLVKKSTKEEYFDSVIYTLSACSRQMQVYLLKQLGQGEETSSDDCYNSFQINIRTQLSVLDCDTKFCNCGVFERFEFFEEW